MPESAKKTILVAPLNWGLGHATRCIPIIRALMDQGYSVLLGSEGAALQLLRKEFPQLSHITLPSYAIRYPRNGLFFKLKLLRSLPAIQRAIQQEHQQVAQLVDEGAIEGIISDNRPGVYHIDVPSVYLTHQVVVLSGATSAMSSRMHQRHIQKFDSCWVPDVAGTPNLSGALGHPPAVDFPLTYIGPLSRMKAKPTETKYDILIVLSGPEPQRSLLENRMLEVFTNTKSRVLLVRGVIEDEEQIEFRENLAIANFMTTRSLEQVLNESELVIARSGYTTIMDLAAMGKKAFFIPTPGQYEQNYLAKQLEKQKIAPYCRQREFTLENLKKVDQYSGFQAWQGEQDLSRLFGLFEGK
ncbi:MAG: glycosyltransferase [Bacteroidota bacterium]